MSIGSIRQRKGAGCGDQVVEIVRKYPHRRMLKVGQRCVLDRWACTRIRREAHQLGGC